MNNAGWGAGAAGLGLPNPHWIASPNHPPLQPARAAGLADRVLLIVRRNRCAHDKAASVRR